MQAHEVKRGLPATLLLAICGLGKMRQPFVYPGPWRVEGSMRELVHRGELGQSRITVEGCEQHASALVRRRLRIAQLHNFGSDFGSFLQSTKPLGHKRD